MKIPGFKELALLLVVAIPWYKSSAQSLHLPASFKVQDCSSLGMAQSVREVRDLVGQTNDFWIAFQFELRPDMRFRHIQIDRDGDIHLSINHDCEDCGYWDEDDLRTTTLRALDNLGDKDALEALKKESKTSKNHAMNLAAFYLLDAQTERLKSVRFMPVSRYRALNDGNVVWLKNLSTTASYEYLKEIISGEETPRRIVKPAIFLLSSHAYDGVIGTLADIVASDRKIDIRSGAALWLAHIPDGESLRALTRIYEKEESLEMKQKLIFAISQHKSQTSQRYLMQIARSRGSLSLREKAVFWLGQNHDDQSFGFLKQLLAETQEQALREKLVFSLSQHGSPAAVEELIRVARTDRDHNVREKAIFWLGQMASRKTLKALGKFVESEPETDLKTHAVFAISQHGNRDEAVEMLIQIAKNNPSSEVRSKALFWLGQTNSEKSINFLREILTQ